ncbi:SEC-C motif-containing protein [Luteibacter rhizovicinus]|uniref:UPF0225 protein EC912_102437 n=1 Tax=Luteibacter rhizovicinus TaxID=242606 RepID=A0A4R3YW94_9GAMM|nr:YchJ family protein [Luteibacter rhizovicinus]TCV96088.1 SEC-C motif-containing protein [Luteibacter rhizovicinus]
MTADNHGKTCVCGSGKTYGACCALYHEGAAAPTAEALMRSRYSAYVFALEDYLRATWHPDTRPASLNLAAQSPRPTWLGLDVKRHEISGADTAVVEFVARFRHGGGRAERLHETSRFVREDGRWFYVDGDIQNDRL